LSLLFIKFPEDKSLGVFGKIYRLMLASKFSHGLPEIIYRVFSVNLISATNYLS